MHRADYDVVTFAQWRVGDRVEIHPACDAWMRGARFGTITAKIGGRLRIRMDHPGIKRCLYLDSSYVRPAGGR